MSLEKNPNSILKVLDFFFLSDEKASLDQLQNISQLLTNATEPLAKIQQKFHFYFAYESFTKIAKVLDLLEYLTVAGSTRVPDIVNHEKFLKTFTTVVMEPQFQANILNLLRLWHDQYDKERGKLNQVFEVIENLQLYLGIEIPNSYTSKYEEIKPNDMNGALSDKKEQKQANEEITIKLSNENNSELLLTKAETLRNQANKLLNDSDFNKTPKGSAENTVEIITENINKVLGELISFKIFVQNENLQQRLDNLIEDLTRLKEEIKKKGKVSSDPKGVQSKSIEQKVDNLNNPSSTMMDINEFLIYKTQECKAGMSCCHVPLARKGFSRINPNCSFWHGINDQRRAVCDENGTMTYSPELCKISHQHYCQNAHNQYEVSFHILNYKKKPCSFNMNCKNGKYCPYYHSIEERETWENNLRDFFSIEATEMYGYNQSSAHDFNNGYYSNFNHVGQSATVPLVNNQNYQGTIQYIPKPKVSYEEKKDSMVNEPKIKQTQSKLVIRNSFVNPGKLTALFKVHPCFHGIPLFTSQALDINKNDNYQMKGLNPSNEMIIKDKN